MFLLAKVVTLVVALARSLLNRCLLGLVAAIAIACLTFAQLAFALDLHARRALPPLGAFVLFFVGSDPTPAHAVGHGAFVAAVAAHPIATHFFSAAIAGLTFAILNRRLATLRPEVDEARALVRMASPFLVVVVLDALIATLALLVTIVARG
jgi:hypothetical protein